MFEKFRVYLRALEPDDYKTSIKWRKNDLIWDMVVGPKYFVSEAYEKKWVEDVIFNSPNKLVLAICLKETNEHIGYSYLTNIDWKNRNALSGKMIGEPKCWGKGYGTEVTMLLLYHAFMVMGLQRVESVQLINNIAAIKTIEKNGYKKEGILRKAVFKNGEYQDLNLMSIIRDDFDIVLEKYRQKGKL